MSQEESNTGQNDVVIVRGRVDSLSLYEITDYELDTLERGSPGSLYLNFGIFLFSVGLSFLITLLSTTVQPSRIFTVFVVLSSVGLLGGSFLLLLWYRMRSDVTDVVSKIKKRIAAQEEVSTSPDG